ncbi:hypothetical protein ACJX0J_006603 [Zea mays]
MVTSYICMHVVCWSYMSVNIQLESLRELIIVRKRENNKALFYIYRGTFDIPFLLVEGILALKKESLPAGSSSTFRVPNFQVFSFIILFPIKERNIHSQSKLIWFHANETTSIHFVENRIMNLG